MLMKLLWALTEPFVRPALEAVPEAPDPVTWALPWPDALPAWPAVGGLVSVLVAGAAFLFIKFLRWVYGLIPVVQ